jgi:hypothetical protein
MLEYRGIVRREFAHAVNIDNMGFGNEPVERTRRISIILREK